MSNLAPMAAAILLSASAVPTQPPASPPAGDGTTNENLAPKPEVPVATPTPAPSPSATPTGQAGTKAEASPPAGDPTAATDAPPKRGLR